MKVFNRVQRMFAGITQRNFLRNRIAFSVQRASVRISRWNAAAFLLRFALVVLVVQVSRASTLQTVCDVYAIGNSGRSSSSCNTTQTGSSVNTTETATLYLSLDPYLFTTASSSTDLFGTDAAAGSNVNAMFEVIGPAASVVPLLVNASASTSATGSGSACAEIGIELNSAPFTSFLGLEAGVNSPCEGQSSFSFDADVLIAPNKIQELILEVSSTSGNQAGLAGPQAGAATATLDPIITIDPSFADAGNYQLEFSPDFPVTAPEPGTVLLLGVGLASLGQLRRRFHGAGWRLSDSGASRGKAHGNARYIWKSPALLLLTLGARTAMADQGIAYALITDGTSATVSAEYSLNPGGGAVTATRNGTGLYTVVFPNSAISDGWSAQATAYGANANYCNIAVIWGTSGSGSAIVVQCYNSSDVAADSPFTVLAVSKTNDKNIAFAWADQRSTASYAPNPSYAYNPGGAINITRSSAGTYQVTFSGVSGAGGTVQITALGGNASCYSGPWGNPPFIASVDCIDPAGNPVDSDFVIAIVPAGVTPTGIAFSWAGQDSTPTYTPLAIYSYNPTGSAVNVTRSSAGQYVVTYAGLNAAQVSGGNVRATAEGAATRCKVTDWATGPGSTLQVFVGCYNLAGGPTDSRYQILALPPMGYAYALIENGATASVSPTFQVNPGGAPVTASHNGTGLYFVEFFNSGIGTGWSVQAIAYGGTADYCEVVSWGGTSSSTGRDIAEILCFTSAGVAADSEFTVSAVSNTNDKNIAFALADRPSAAVIYTPDPLHSYNPAGTITASRSATGLYSVVFNGLYGVGVAGTVQVTAFGSDNTSCSSDGWGGSNFTAAVVCRNPSGTPVDSAFVIAVIPVGAGPSGIGFAYANQPTAASYTPSYSYNSAEGGEGPVNVVRNAPGQYVMTFSGLSPEQVVGGDVRATANHTASLCEVANWGTLGADVVVDVYCQSGGAFTDSEYEVLVFAPVIGAPATVEVIAGSPQSAPVTTPFGVALSAKVTDGNGNPVPNVTVTFTAPGSSASGTFPGSELTATAVANAGVATAPVFTANTTPGGPYSVTASVLGVATTANFSLTNTPLTPVTLQTSPPGLQVSLDGGGFVAAPLTVSLVPVSTHTIVTETPQAGAAGIQHAWVNWSDSGAISHSITVPTTTITYTATFQTQYQLTISASPVAGGSVTPPSGTFYNAATVVAVGATANAGYTFNGWSGSVASATSASTTVTMSAPETVTANFLPFTNITIQTSPTGLQVSVDGGPPQAVPQTLSLPQGPHTIAVVTTQAGTQGTQYVFTAWSDGLAASHSITVGGSPATYTATFQTQYQLTTAASPGAGGSVTPASGAFYPAATAVSITATANAGYAFNNWSGPVASAFSASTTVTMSAPESVTANFSSLTGITIQTSPPGLQVGVDGVAYTAPQTLNLTPGTHTIAVVTMQAGAAGTQYVFSQWSDGGAASHSITVGSSAATYTATFTTQYLLTTAVSPSGAGTVAASPASAGFYNAGTSVQLTASANAGYQFSNWIGDLSGSTNPQSIIMNAAHSVTADFTTVISACSFVLTPASASLPPTGTSTVETCPNGSGQPNCGVTPETPVTFTITPSAACGAWAATSSNPEFLQITAGSSGSGVGTVGYALLNNTHTLPQSYTITVASATGSATYSVTKAGSGDDQVYREVYALYEQLLGRDPDPAGFAFWSGAGGAGLGQMADSFLTSPEFFDSGFAVMAAYQAATGGPPTYAQFTAAAASVRAGAQTVPGLFTTLSGANPGYSATTLYQNLLNRATTSGDAACIASGLANCFQTIIGYPAPAATNPVGATNNEFQSTGIYHTTLAADHTNALYVQMIYYVTLSRDPDPAGYAFWLGIANGGGPGLLFQGSAGFGTRIQIMGPGTPNQGFIGSPEFQGLFAN